MSKRLTQEEFENKIFNKYGDKFKVISLYKTVLDDVELQCNNCKYIFCRKPKHLYCSNVVCPKCEQDKSSILAIKGINDIWTTHPRVGSLLFNKEDGYNYRINTGTKLLFKCPDCGKTDLYLPSNVSMRGLSCKYCSDGISYPNKFIRNILNILKIDFIPEFKINDTSYFYDVYFKYKNNKYLIEMDGGYGHGYKDIPNLSKEQQIEIDYQKDKLAKENNYTIIRIDCNYNRVEDRKQYIKDNIKKSLLNNLLDIDDDVYDLADLKSQASNVLLFGELWNSGIYTYEILMHKLNVRSRSTIKRYGKICINLNIINISYDNLLYLLKQNSLNRKIPHRSQPIRCIQTNQLFSSIAEAERQLKIKHINKYFNKNYLYCGVSCDGTKLTWEKIPRKQYIQNLINESLKGV